MGFFDQESEEKPETQEKSKVEEKKAETPTGTPQVEATEELSTEAQLTLLAKEHKMTLEEMKSKFEKIKTESFGGKGEKGALAVLKAELGAFERANKSKEFIARLIAIEGNRELTDKKDQHKYLASSMEFIVLEEGKPVSASMWLRDKNAELYKKFWPLGEVFKFTCGYFLDRTTKTPRLTVGDDGKLDVTQLTGRKEKDKATGKFVSIPDDPLAKGIPTFQELAKPRVQHLNQMGKYDGQTAVFSATISRHMQRTDGTYLGIEITDGTIMKTLSCFLSEPLLSKMGEHRIPEGTDIWVYGYVSHDQEGNPRISPRGIYPPAA